MPLLSSSELILLTDKMAYLWDRLGAFCGTSDYGSYVAGTSQYVYGRALADVMATEDYDQVSGLSASLYNGVTGFSRELLASSAFSDFASSLESHVTEFGPALDDSVVDLATLLTFLNATPYSVLLHPSLGDAWLSVTGVALPVVGLAQPSSHPWLNAAATLGLGTNSVGGSFAAGAEISTTYSPPTIAVEVTTAFSGGSANPTVTVSGVDDSGLGTTTWTADLGSNNPTASVSTTIAPAVAATSRVTVAVGSATGIVVGSVLKVNAGLIDEEVVSVEAVVGSTLTAVFDKAHLAGAALTGFSTFLLAPSVAGARPVSVSNVSIGITGHSAGAVRVFGVLSHQHDPS